MTLGLDLQGGIHMVLELDLVDLMINLVNDETGVISITVNKAAEKTANGYFAIFIIIWVKL